MLNSVSQPNPVLNRAYNRFRIEGHGHRDLIVDGVRMELVRRTEPHRRDPEEPGGGAAARGELGPVHPRLATEDLEKEFLKEAGPADLAGLKGHRSVGGLRASIYNAVSLAAVEALAQFMKEFARRNG